MNRVVLSVYSVLLEVGLGGFVVVCLFLAGFPYAPLSVLNLREISQPLPPEMEHAGIKGVHNYACFTSLLKLLSPFERCFSCQVRWNLCLHILSKEKTEV